MSDRDPWDEKYDNTPDVVDTLNDADYEAEMARRRRRVREQNADDYWYGQRAIGYQQNYQDGSWH